MKNNLKTLSFAVLACMSFQNASAAQYLGFLPKNTVYVDFNVTPPTTVRVYNLLHFKPPLEGKTEEVIDFVSIVDKVSKKITTEKELAQFIKTLEKRTDGRFFLIKKEVAPEKIFDQDGIQLK